MDTESFNSANDLFKQAFLFRKYRNMNIVAAICYAIITLPFLLDAVVLFCIFKIQKFIFRLIKSPADYLDNFIHNEGQDVKHATQAIIYFVGFPQVFFLNVLIAFIVPFLFIIYFMLNCECYCFSLGDIPFNPYLNEKIDRDFSLDHSKRYNNVFVFLHLGLSTLFFVLAIVFTVFTFSNLDNLWPLILFIVFLLAYISMFAISGIFFSSQNMLPVQEKIVKPAKEIISSSKSNDESSVKLDNSHEKAKHHFYFDKEWIRNIFAGDKKELICSGVSFVSVLIIFIITFFPCATILSHSVAYEPIFIYSLSQHWSGNLNYALFAIGCICLLYTLFGKKSPLILGPILYFTYAVFSIISFICAMQLFNLVIGATGCYSIFVNAITACVFYFILAVSATIYGVLLVIKIKKVKQAR